MKVLGKIYNSALGFISHEVEDVILITVHKFMQRWTKFH